MTGLVVQDGCCVEWGPASVPVVIPFMVRGTRHEFEALLRAVAKHMRVDYERLSFECGVGEFVVHYRGSTASERNAMHSTMIDYIPVGMCLEVR